MSSSSITDKYNTLGGAKGIMGAEKDSVDLAAADGVGKYRRYENGAIYSHPTYGTHNVMAGVRKKWMEVGGEAGLLGYPTADASTEDEEFRYVSQFQHGTISEYAFARQITFYGQNMALLPKFIQLPEALGSFKIPVNEYKGADRGKALGTLIAKLQAEKPDVVGLSEMWDADEIETLTSAVANIYPYSYSGPKAAGIQTQAGDLLLLSREPLAGLEYLAYQTGCIHPATGVKVLASQPNPLTPDGKPTLCIDLWNDGKNFQYDFYSRKGVLVGVVSVPGAPFPLNVAVTHTQAPYGGRYQWLTQLQVSELGHLLADAASRRVTPTLLLGDLNTDLNDDELLDDFMSRTYDPEDVWESAEEAWKDHGSPDDPATFPLGITKDDASAFKSPSTEARFQNGKRIDGVMAWSGSSTSSSFSSVGCESTSVVVTTFPYEGQPRDMSDHYGMMTTIKHWYRCTLRREINRITVRVASFECLTTKNRLLPDQISFKISGSTKTVDSATIESRDATSETTSVHDAGKSYPLPDPPTVFFTEDLASIGTLAISVEGFEGGELIEERTITLARSQMLTLCGRTVDLRPRVFENGRAVYTVTLTIDIE